MERVEKMKRKVKLPPKKALNVITYAIKAIYFLQSCYRKPDVIFRHVTNVLKRDAVYYRLDWQDLLFACRWVKKQAKDIERIIRVLEPIREET